MIGQCHICGRQDMEIEYCSLCGHWFDKSCRARWFHRGLSATKQLIDWLDGGRQRKPPSCCGPREKRDE